jgi:hypothetical protein
VLNIKNFFFPFFGNILNVEERIVLRGAAPAAKDPRIVEIAGVDV